MNVLLVCGVLHCKPLVLVLNDIITKEYSTCSFIIIAWIHDDTLG